MPHGDSKGAKFLTFVGKNLVLNSIMEETDQRSNRL